MFYVLGIKTDHAPETVLAEFYDLFIEKYTIEYSEEIGRFVGLGPLTSYARHATYQMFAEIEVTVEIDIPHGMPGDNDVLDTVVMRWFNLHLEDSYCLVGDATWVMQINGELRIDYAFQLNMDYSTLTRPFEFAKLPQT